MDAEGNKRKKSVYFVMQELSKASCVFIVSFQDQQVTSSTSVLGFTQKEFIVSGVEMQQ